MRPERYPTIPEGTRIGQIVVGARSPGTKAKDSTYACKCDCGRRFTRRTYDIWRAHNQQLDASCGQGACHAKASNNHRQVSDLKALMMSREFRSKRHRMLGETPRPKQPMCKVCGNQSWRRLPSDYNDSQNGKTAPVLGPDLRCRGCGGKYAPEQTERVDATLRSSGAMWDNVE
jgi:hypothetical protein